MAAVKVGINGFGRIGRITFRALAARPDEFEVVAINDLGDPQKLAWLLKYDSVQGRFPGTVEAEGSNLIVNGKTVRVCAERDPRNLPWKELGVEVALESTGFFTKREADGNPGYDSHITAGARKVVISAPAKDTPDMTVVFGVNDDQLTSEHNCVSNASCTTNCLAPMAKVIHENFGIEHGLMTTVHAYTNDQRVSDQLHSDPLRARAAAVNIIPTTTGAAKAVGLVLPDLNGKLTGLSLRVPVPAGSITDLVVTLSKDVSADDVNAAMKAAAEGPLKGILEYNTDPIVSSDIIGNTHSSIFDATWTTQIGGNMIKVLSWYDNEYGYSNRTADMIARLAQL
ncbi:type I glyceraldehyde-3-phosphate dehydrogenase [Gimesia chilikensis]|uniref:Glyceraldehyde-3-phosphate dehydrogenase n=1 Tax=Gimesia chilikensis TaxID=2605989 RepID=A0A517PN43_9PLAN|nr:type I glyceraldehyde-3-phosphate dehydrogenase [Gimesia chilikensis]MBN68021.1 type I glyceraldehyde-3-phosphate dehydrogenase [Gimesia sp.]MCR9232052.1 type I glyceraldehyde-3-phosphate dehydrogenase [bacterium]QDT20795.1 Glyceraldehyde-3-phosphate dehydrogenase [Gimesia chilikensis]QDT84815.1 Glyceraldehyde-3-phosphate dehydrogenase [Gimesia chilikensis]